MNAWIDLIGWTLLHFVWEGTLIGAATAASLFACRRAAAQVRYVIACTGLVAALAAAAVTPVALIGVDVLVVPAAPPDSSFRPQPIVTAAASIRTMVAGSVAAARSVQIDDQAMNTALSTVVLVWAAGVLLLTIRLAFGWWRVRRLHVEALQSQPSRWLATTQGIATRLGVTRMIHVIDSLDVDTPTVVGWLRPVVLLPIAALANLTPEQVQAILAHELAHVRRHDFIVNLLQTVAETVLFYHPAVWWVSSRIRAEREHCCDDIAVEVCGDPVGYAEALTTIATWARGVDAPAQAATSPLAVAATGGSLLHRVQRLLRLTPDSERRRPKATFVIAATVMIVGIVGARLLVVAQAPPPFDDPRLDRALGPMDVNRILGFELFPGPVHYVTDDPQGARAWDVKVAYPDGEMAFMGFTARGLVRYAYHMEGMPVIGGPSWLDTQSIALRAETSTANPGDEAYRDAIRVALASQFGLTVRQESRVFPVYALKVARAGGLGPNIRPATADCVQDIRTRVDLLGPSLHERGQVVVPFCGIDNTITGPKGLRVTLEQFAHGLRGFGMYPTDRLSAEPEVVDQTGLSGVYDFELNLGFLPLAAIASAHPTVGIGFGPMVRTFPQAIEEQLGLRLVPSEASREVAVISAAEQARQHENARVRQQLADARVR